MISTAKLTLRIRGEYFNHQDIELPAWIRSMDFETNVKRREHFIAEEAEKLRTQYLRTILKFNGEYDITLDVASDEENRPYQLDPTPFIILTNEHEQE